MPWSRMPMPEAEVGHHGGDDRVLGEPAVVAPVDGGDGDDLVAVDEPAVGIDRQHPVGVTIEGEPGVGTALDHRLLQVLRVGGPAPRVDVRAVGFVVEHLDGRAEGTQHLGGPHRRGAVRAVERPATRPRGRGHRSIGRTESAHRPTCVGAVDHRADRVTGARRRCALVGEERVQLGLERGLDVVGELAPARREQLHPVVLVAVVRRRDHRAGRVLGGREPRDRRGRHHAEARDLGALGRRDPR